MTVRLLQFRNDSVLSHKLLRPYWIRLFMSVEPVVGVQRKDAAHISFPKKHTLVSVVMPCLNEEQTLGICIEKIKRTFADNDIDGEIIVADNGSTDRSREIAEKLGARVVPVAQKGYGSALMGGFQAARGTYVLMGDADDSYDFSHLPRFLEKLEQGYDLVMGNRFQGGIAPRAMPFLHQYLGNPVLSLIGRIFFHSSIGDFHCGLRAFRREAVNHLCLRTTGMEFASEMIVKASLHNLRITEIPTTLKQDGRNRPPHLRSWRDGWRHLSFMLLFSPRWLFIYPGAILMLVGLILMLWLLPGSRQIGQITLDIHTMVYSLAMILLGFQAVLFGVLSKIYAVTSGLIPKPDFWNPLFRWFNLELGLVIGATCFIAGIIGSCLAIGIWEQNGFQSLDPVQTLRLVIPSVGVIALGGEIILASFFISVLGLSQK